jgi:hypothetical protein
MIFEVKIGFCVGRVGDLGCGDFEIGFEGILGGGFLSWCVDEVALPKAEASRRSISFNYPG